MRRVSYHFPRTYDYTFSVQTPFHECLARIVTLVNRQDNFRDSRGAVKREFVLGLACNRLDFEQVTPMALATVTDEADFSLTLSDTILRAAGSRPEPSQKFMIKVLDSGAVREIFIAHTTEPQSISWREVAECLQQVMA